uniref:Serpentine receptor class gamma n=1 Tax=Panagrellus redivivus TaxID=6233 RepID=A0A7E4WCM3_PANRE
MNSTNAQLEFDAFVTSLTKTITAFSCAVSCPLYLLVLFVVYKLRHSAPFNSEFFTIYAALGMVDITCYLLFLFRKLPHWHIEWEIYKPYNQPNNYMKVLFFLIWWFGHAQFQLTILIGINRFASVVMFKTYKQYWTSRFTRIAITFLMLTSMSIALPVLFLDCAVLRYSSVFNGVTILHTVGPAFMNSKAMVCLI